MGTMFFPPPMTGEGIKREGILDLPLFRAMSIRFTLPDGLCGLAHVFSLFEPAFQTGCSGGSALQA